MKNKFTIVTLAAVSMLFSGCTDVPPVVITADELRVTIEENPEVGQLLGKINVNIVNEDNSSMFLMDGDLSDYISFDESTKEVTVSDPSIFDFETQETYYANVKVNASNKNSSVGYEVLIVITLTNVIERSEMSVQELLDAGETPLEIYTSNNSLLSDLYGATYAGGLIFYFNTSDGTGLVAAEADLAATLPWDPNAPTGGFLQTNETLTAIGTGATNTAGIIADLGDGTYAAKACADLTLNGFSDWFLPSIDELSEIWKNLRSVGLGNFTNGFYWSSSETQNSGNQAWHVDFTNPNVFLSTGAFKDDLDNVRAVRAF